MKLDPKKQEVFQNLGKFTNRLSDGMLEFIAMFTQAHFDRINDAHDLDDTLQNQLTEVLSFVSMNATVKTLVVLVETMIEVFGEATPDQVDMVKLSEEICFCLNQRLSKVFPDLVDLNSIRLRKEELN